MPNKKISYTLPAWTRKLSKPLSRISDSELNAWGSEVATIEGQNQTLYRELTDKHRQLMELAKVLLSADQCTRLARNAKVSPPPALSSMWSDFRRRVYRARRVMEQSEQAEAARREEAELQARREQEELEARRAKQREYNREYRARQKAEAEALLNQRLEAVGSLPEEA